MDNNMKILTIGDIGDNLISLGALIQEAYPASMLFTSTDGHQGVEIARIEDPDVVFLDFVMPGTNGNQVCHEIKSDPATKDIPVVFITALKSDRENRRRALEAGADGFLTMPVDEIELTAQINVMARIKKMNHEKRQEVQVSSGIGDITGRRQLEEQLIMSESRFRTLFDLAADGILLSDPEGLIVAANHAFYEISGLSEEDILGIHISKLLFEPESFAKNPFKFEPVRKGLVVETQRSLSGLMANGSTLKCGQRCFPTGDTIRLSGMSPGGNRRSSK